MEKHQFLQNLEPKRLHFRADMDILGFRKQTCTLDTLPDEVDLQTASKNPLVADVMASLHQSYP